MIDVTRCVQGIGNGSVKIDMASCELRIDRFGELPIVVDLRGALHHVGGLELPRKGIDGAGEVVTLAVRHGMYVGVSRTRDDFFRESSGGTKHATAAKAAVARAECLKKRKRDKEARTTEEEEDVEFLRERTREEDALLLAS